MSDYRAAPTQPALPPMPPQQAPTPAASVLRALSLALLVMAVVAYLMAWAVDADGSLSYETQSLGFAVIATLCAMALTGSIAAALCGWWLKRRAR